MNRVGQSIARPQSGQVKERIQAAEPELPLHAERFLSRLQTHFPTARDARAWDDTDTLTYGRQVIALSELQTREVFFLLTERHTFRPSVAHVNAVVREVTCGQANDATAISDMRIMRTAEEVKTYLHGPPDYSLPALTCPDEFIQRSGREQARRDIAALRGKESTLKGQNTNRLKKPLDKGDYIPDTAEDRAERAARRQLLHAQAVQLMAMELEIVSP